MTACFARLNPKNGFFDRLIQRQHNSFQIEAESASVDSMVMLEPTMAATKDRELSLLRLCERETPHRLTLPMAAFREQGDII